MLSRSKVLGWISEKQCDEIVDLVSSLGPNAKILEIGAAYGRSTFSILDGMKSTQTLDVCDLWDIEHHRGMLTTGDYKETLFGDKENLMNNLVETVKNYGPYQAWFNTVAQHRNFKLIRNVFKHASQDLKDTNYDLVYLDGHHSKRSVLQELIKFKNVPIICGDDFCLTTDEFKGGIPLAVLEFRKYSNRILTANLQSFFYILRIND